LQLASPWLVYAAHELLKEHLPSSEIAMKQQPERDLQQLVRSMQPELLPDEFVFITVPDIELMPSMDPVMVFQENEGITMIVKRERAEERRLAFEFPCKMITLNVHSALDAVGFLAIITSRLAESGMGVNPVSAFHHDHLFVPSDRADDALKALENLIEENH